MDPIRLPHALCRLAPDSQTASYSHRLKVRVLIRAALTHPRPNEVWPEIREHEAAAAALRGWENRYNFERFSLALQGRTPAEKLAALQPPRRAA